jgi:ABC-type Fe3+/spermidine/putrescine transport system ATPase subunit
MVHLGGNGRPISRAAVRGSAAARGAGAALVFDPQLVLMDEPLGALDKQLREHMQMS